MNRELLLTHPNFRDVTYKRAEDSQECRIGGYGAVFYDGTPETEYELWPGVVERFQPGCFDDLESDDIRCTFNHNFNHLLGRTKSGSTTLSVDSVGYSYETIINPKDTRAMDFFAQIEREDVDGSSIWFFIESETRTETDDLVVYDIVKVRRVVELGPVTIPAYEGTTAETRSQHIAARKKQIKDAAADRMRRRQKDLDKIKADSFLLGLRD